MKNINTKIVYIFLISMFSIITACDKDKSAPENSLAAYILDENLAITNLLIACAAGGQTGFMDEADFPMSMYFKPQPKGVTDIRYYETSSISENENNLGNFIEVDRPDEPLLNGFLHRFKLPKPDKDVWARVSYISDDTLWYCKAVHLKYNENPSLFQPDFLSIDSSDPISPIFSWEDEPNTDNIIYFQVVADEDGNAISGTYTEERSFQFYNLDNVVLNVTHPGATPALTENNNYEFILMGVDGENWVNLVATSDFGS